MHRTQLISPFKIRICFLSHPSTWCRHAQLPDVLAQSICAWRSSRTRRPASCKLVINKWRRSWSPSWFGRPEGYLQLRWKRWPSSSLQRRWRRPMPPTEIAPGWSSTYTSSIGRGQVYGRLAVAWLSLSCGGFQICLVLITASRFILNVGIGLIVE